MAVRCCFRKLPSLRCFVYSMCDQDVGLCRWMFLLVICVQEPAGNMVLLLVKVLIYKAACKTHGSLITIDFIKPLTKPGLLEGYVKSLFDEGVVNDQFSQIQTLKSVEQPDLVVQMINSYLVDVEMILSELTSYSDIPDVDFSKVALLAHKVKERSSCIGAEHVRLACDELIQASDQMHKQNFVRALSWIKKEFSCTQSKLEDYVQMERRIIRLESRRKGKGCLPSNSA